MLELDDLFPGIDLFELGGEFHDVFRRVALFDQLGQKLANGASHVPEQRFVGVFRFALLLLEVVEIFRRLNELALKLFEGSVCLLLGLLFWNNLESKIFCELKVSSHLFVDFNEVFRVV